MTIEIASPQAVTKNVPINKIATHNQGDQRDIQRVNQQSSVAAAHDDRVILTAAAERLRQAEDSSVKQPVVDTKRVENIREQINNGTYRVNASRVADKLFNFESSLNGASRKH
ncbi:negative regulator of flagellin synthesis FlgM [Gammaproteobacteria bacterium]